MRNNLEKIRKDRKVRQEQLAKAVGVSRQTIGSIENGRYNPSVVLAINIARYFDKTVEDIFMVEYESRWLDITDSLRLKNKNYKSNYYIEQPDDLILNQNEEPWNSFKYGNFKFGFNGGELAAIYNVCKMLSKDIKLAEIILQFESNEKAILGGMAGTDPKVLGEFFKAHNIEHSFYTELMDINNIIEEGKVFIISYWVKDKLKELKGLHTVAGKYSGDKFIIYNAVNNSNEILELDSLKELTKQSQMIGGYIFEN